MLPLVDKPTIQYGVEEALQLRRPEHRRRHRPRQERDRGSLRRVEGARGLSREPRQEGPRRRSPQDLEPDPACPYVRQGEPLGLGHAVLVTETIVGNEPFAVILADDVIDATPPALKQMIDVFERAGGPVLAVERVPMEKRLELRRDRRRAGARARQGRLSRHGSRREAAARRGAVGPRDHRPLHPDAGHLPVAARDRARTSRARSSSPTGCATC